MALSAGTITVAVAVIGDRLLTLVPQGLRADAYKNEKKRRISSMKLSRVVSILLFGSCRGLLHGNNRG